MQPTRQEKKLKLDINHSFTPDMLSIDKDRRRMRPL